MHTLPRLSVLAALAAGLAWPSAAGHAAMPEAPLPFDDLAPLNAEELGQERGGMMINGISMDFAIVIRTTVDGAVANGLQTVLTVNDQGGLGSAITTPIGPDTAVATDGNGTTTLALPAGTTIVHEVQDGHVQALIANTANGVTLDHSTEINVTLPGITGQGQSWYSASSAMRAGTEAALRGLGGR